MPILISSWITECLHSAVDFLEQILAWNLSSTDTTRFKSMLTRLALQKRDNLVAENLILLKENT